MSERGWVLLLAAGSFAAGLVLGLLLPGAVSALDGGEAAADPQQDYVRRMAADFGLSKDQERVLHMVVATRQDEELGVLRRADFEQLPAALQTQIKNVRRREVERIRALLNPAQLLRYDAQVRPETDR